MATIINLQGFPKVASEAIEFSYFLSESEKAEWREWLKTATPEQQEELVDILYSMWQDNQKNAVPENLANNQNSNTQPVATAAAPVTPIPPLTETPSYGNTSQSATFPGFNTQPTAPQFPTNNNFAQSPVPSPILAPNYSAQQFPAAPQINSVPTPLPLPEIPSFVPAAPVVSSATAQIPDFNQTFGGNNLNIPSQNIAQPATTTQSNPSFLNPQTPVQPEIIPEKPSFVQTSDDFSTQNNTFTAFPSQPVDFSQAPATATAVVDTVPTFLSQPEIEKPAVVEPKPEPTPVKPTISEAVTTPPTINIDTSFDFDDEGEDEVDFEEPIKELKKNGDINMESLVNDNKYRPNPILEDNGDTETEFVFKNSSEPITIEKPKPATPKPAVQTKDNDDQEENTNTDSEPKRVKENKNNSKPQSYKGNNKKDQVIEFNSLKDPGTKDMLNEIYNDYIETYDSNQKKFVVFLDRVTKVLSNYETISSHFENLTGKVVDINDKMVAQARDIQALKDATRTQAGTSIQEQIDDLRFDLDNLEKDVRSLRTESRRKTSELSQQMAAVGADSYGDGGVIQKIELLKSDINNLKQDIQANSATNNHNLADNVPTKSSKLDLTGII